MYRNPGGLPDALAMLSLSRGDQRHEFLWALCAAHTYVTISCPCICVESCLGTKAIRGITVSNLCAGRRNVTYLDVRNPACGV